jgi:hypothetical protein
MRFLLILLLLVCAAAQGNPCRLATDEAASTLCGEERCAPSDVLVLVHNATLACDDAFPMSSFASLAVLAHASNEPSDLLIAIDSQGRWVEVPLRDRFASPGVASSAASNWGTRPHSLAQRVVAHDDLRERGFTVGSLAIGAGLGPAYLSLQDPEGGREVWEYSDLSVRPSRRLRSLSDAESDDCGERSQGSYAALATLDPPHLLALCPNGVGRVVNTVADKTSHRIRLPLTGRLQPIGAAALPAQQGLLVLEAEPDGLGLDEGGASPRAARRVRVVHVADGAWGLTFGVAGLGGHTTVLLDCTVRAELGGIAVTRCPCGTCVYLRVHLCVHHTLLLRTWLRAHTDRPCGGSRRCGGSRERRRPLRSSCSLPLRGR